MLALIFCFCLRSSNKLRSPESGSVTLLISVLVESWTKGCSCFPSSPPKSYKPIQRLAFHPEPRSVPWESSCGVFPTSPTHSQHSAATAALRCAGKERCQDAGRRGKGNSLPEGYGVCFPQWGHCSTLMLRQHLGMQAAHLGGSVS